jgi:outer membrane protein TolC/predicted transcriptional regulator
MPQFFIMEHLLRQGESKMTDLARCMNVTTAAMTGMVDRLVREGYMARDSDPKDRRIILMKLTARGSELVKKIKAQRRKMIVDIFGRLSETDRRDYLRVLMQVRSIMAKTTAAMLIAALALAAPARAEEVTLTLDEAINIALRDNRDILLKAEDIKDAQAQIRESHAPLFPSLSFSATRADTRNYYPQTVGQTDTDTGIKQYLYRGGKTMNTIRQKESELIVAQSLLDKQKLELILSVKKGFYTLFLAREFAGLNKAIVKNTEAHLAFLRERYQAGQASESDIINMQASLASVRKVWDASASQVAAGEATLCNLLYMDKEVRVEPKAELRCEPSEIAYDEAFLKAMQSRPEIKQYEAQAMADEKAVEIAKADTRPEVYAAWNYYTNSHTSNAAGLTKGWNDYHILGVTVSWPIFDGWETRAKVEQALIDLKQTQLTKEKTQKDIALELKNAYLSLKNAIAKLDASGKDIALYSDTVATTREKYRQGIASGLDMKDADLKYEIALFNEKQAVYDYIIAKSSFDKAIGGV